MTEVVAWLDADGYLRRHLASHAAAGRLLDELVEDPAYLAVAEPSKLITAINRLSNPEAQEFGRVYTRVAHRLRSVDTAERMALIHLMACQEAPHLARRLEPPVLTRWRCEWAAWRSTTPHRVLVGPNEPVVSLAIGAVGESEVVVAGTDAGQIWIWDARTGELAVEQPNAVGAGLVSLALGEIDHRPLVATVHYQNSRLEIRTLDARTGELGPAHRLPYAAQWAGAGQIDSSLVVVAMSRNKLAVLNAETGEQVVGLPVPTGFNSYVLIVDKTDTTALVMGGSDDDKASIFDVRTRQLMWTWRSRPEGGIDLWGKLEEGAETTALGTIDGKVVVIAAGYEETVILDGQTGRRLGNTIVAGADVSAVAVGNIDSRPTIALGTESGRVVLSEPGTVRKALAPTSSPLHPESIEVVNVDGQPTLVAVAGGRVLRIDPRTGRALGRPFLGPSGTIVRAAATTIVDSAPAIVVASNGNVAVRDLRSGRSLRPHVSLSDRLPAFPWLRVLGSWDSDIAPLLGVVQTRQWGQGRVWMYDARTGSRIGRPMRGPHGRDVSAAAVASVEGTAVVLVASLAGSIWIRNALTGHGLGPPIVVSSAGINALAVVDAVDSPRLVAGTADGEMLLLELSPLRVAERLFACPGAIRAVITGELHGVQVAVVGTDKEEVWIFDLVSGRVMQSIWCGGVITDLAISDAGSLIAVTEQGLLSIWLEAAP